MTNMTGLAQFYFSAGLLGQAIAIPMDVDFPDPALDGLLPIQTLARSRSNSASNLFLNPAACCCLARALWEWAV